MAHAHFLTDQLDQILRALTEKGYHSPHAEITYADRESYTTIRLEYDYKVTPGGSAEYKTIRGRHVTDDDDAYLDSMDMIQAALRQIADLPTVREAQIKALVNTMEAARSMAEDLGVEADIVNPLVTLMERLATNALPKPKQ